MKKLFWKSLTVLLVAGSMIECIDPYTPRLGGYQSLLVVDAFLTDENISARVSLSRTKLNGDDAAERVKDAQVRITDDLGKSITLEEKSEGIYFADSTLFRGEAGRTYTLYIATPEGEEYQSDQCLLSAVPDIDTLYYQKGTEIVNTEPRQGVRIFADSRGGASGGYYRWVYDEWWKLEVPFPKKFNYINDTTIVPYSPLKKTCWANNRSHSINVLASAGSVSRPVLFIDTEKSDRLLIQYYIRVKQLSLSKQEYEFWQLMQQLENCGGDIFDKQPFQVKGNIHCISNTDEQVLGYFQVSGAKSSDIYITGHEADSLGLPRYQYPCEKLTIGREDFIVEGATGPIPSLDQIYTWYTNAGLIFVEPLYLSDNNIKLIFVAPVCADCTLEGTMARPAFWTDL